MNKDIAIIGFGISGIAACRWAIHYGFNPTVYESNSQFGGVWLTHSYINCRLQTTKYSYHYSDLDMPDEYSIYPSGEQVYNYLKSYIQKHNLEKYVNYNSDVQSLKKVVNGWEIIISGNKYTYKYVIISTGFYGKNKTRFPNSILPNDIENPQITLKDKRVVIIGNGPSGCDTACLAVENGAKSVTLLYRSPRWIFSRYLGQISLHFFTWRIFLMIAYYLPRPILRVLLIILYMIPIFWYGYNLKLEFPNEKVNRNNLVLNDIIYNYVNKGLIHMKKDPAISIDEINVITRDNKYEYDIVIDACGYKNGIPLVGFAETVPKLYRNILLPGDNTIGFIGFVASFSWVQVSELQCHWFYQQLLGYFQIPDKTLQQIIIGEIHDRDYHDYAYLVYYYINLLRMDMGLRALNNWFSLPEHIINENETKLR